MKIIKVATLFYTDNSVEHFKRTLRFNPEDYGMTFVYEEENPDFVIVTNYIYESKKIFQKFLNYYNKNVVLIYFAGECTSPDLNIFDYAIVFDRFLQNNDRVARLSTCSFYSVSLFDEYIDSEITQEILESKVNFCNFMYSHSYIYRDQLFAKISQYKKVDSIGKHLNNTGTLNTRHSKDWRKLSIEERLSYKFSIAAENAQFSGYTSEKILSCFQAHTIPIYWGDPTIGKEFNTKAFVNCSDYEDFDAVLERVKEIDNNQELFIDILKEPMQTEAQKKYTFELDQKFNQWVLNIFNQSKQEARRRPIGTYPDMYFNWFCCRYKTSLKNTAKKFVKKILMKNL